MTLNVMEHEVALSSESILSIGDVSRILQIKPHTLRYWESEFDGVCLVSKIFGP